MIGKKSDPTKILSDPLRVQLFELIKEGPKTTPELADILNRDRMELYHHLKMLEETGLINSSYNSQRMKEYTVQSNERDIQHMQQTTIIPPLEDQDFPIGTIILSPPKDLKDNHQFRNLIQKAAELCGSKIPSNFEILQVQIRTEQRKWNELKSDSVSRVKKRRSSRKIT